MEKPVQPMKPFKWFTNNGIEENVLYNVTFIDNDDLKEVDLEGYWEEYHEEDPVPTLKLFSYENSFASLKELINSVPEGLSLDDIFIKIGTNRYRTEFSVDLIHRYNRSQQSMDEEYQEKLDQYEKNLKKYEEDMIVYNKWEKENTIKNAEKEIQRLQKEIEYLKSHLSKV